MRGPVTAEVASSSLVVPASFPITCNFALVKCPGILRLRSGFRTAGSAARKAAQVRVSSSPPALRIRYSLALVKCRDWVFASPQMQANRSLICGCQILRRMRTCFPVKSRSSHFNASGSLTRAIAQSQNRQNQFSQLNLFSDSARFCWSEHIRQRASDRWCSRLGCKESKARRYRNLGRGDLAPVCCCCRQQSAQYSVTSESTVQRLGGNTQR